MGKSIRLKIIHWHDDVIKWRHFPRYWPFVRRIHRSPVNSPHKGQWRGALMFTLICNRIKGWVNNCEAGDLRRKRAHYDVIVMKQQDNEYKTVITFPRTYHHLYKQIYYGSQLLKLIHWALTKRLTFAHDILKPISLKCVNIECDFTEILKYIPNVSLFYDLSLLRQVSH